MKEELDQLILNLESTEFIVFKSDYPNKLAYMLRQAISIAQTLEIEPYNKLKDKYMIRVKRDRIVCESKGIGITRVKADSIPTDTMRYFESATTFSSIITELAVNATRYEVLIFPHINLSDMEETKLQSVLAHYNLEKQSIKNTTLNENGILKMTRRKE